MTRRDTTWATRDLAQPGHDLPEPGAIRWRHHHASMPIPVEDDVAEAVAKVLGALRLTWWHTPNEGTRSVRYDQRGRRYSPEAQRQARQGVKPGVPDVLIFTAPPRIFTPSGLTCAGVAIELKRSQGSEVKQEQLDRLRELRGAGWLVYVCPGYQDALDALRSAGWRV